MESFVGVKKKEPMSNTLEHDPLCLVLSTTGGMGQITATFYIGRPG